MSPRVTSDSNEDPRPVSHNITRGQKRFPQVSWTNILITPWLSRYANLLTFLSLGARLTLSHAGE
jgi:hypothetical protein